MKNSLFEAVYSPKLLAKIEKRFGPFRQEEFELSVSSEVMQRMVDKMQSKPRRGEVVMVIPNAAGDIWLHTKDFYPDGVYRLMTGGIETGEDPQVALRREVWEETGFEVKIERCLAVLTYNFSSAEETLPFVSYIFLTTPAQGIPEPTDSGENITHFKAVPPAALFDAAHQLQGLEGKFADWGMFRAIAHRVVAETLSDEVGQAGHQ